MTLKPFSKNSAFNPRPGLRWSSALRCVAKYICALCLILVIGCSRTSVEPKLPLSEAQKKFVEKCSKDFEMQVITRMVGETLWIYLPIKEPIFDYEAKKETPPAETKPAKFSVQYVDGRFQDNRFSFEYDIISRKKIKLEDTGFSSAYSADYLKQQNNLFIALSDVYFNTVPTKGTVAPKFIVVVVTDIKKGIEAKTTFYLEDLLRTMSGELPYDEYMKRYLAEQKGGQSFIGDETGAHLEYTDISMADFLSKQIINRINLKFQYSDFPPPDDFDHSIVGIVADTTKYYRFKGYSHLQLRNLRNDKTFLFDQTQVASFGEETNSKSPRDGKLIHIRFDNGETTFSE